METIALDKFIETTILHIESALKSVNTAQTAKYVLSSNDTRQENSEGGQVDFDLAVTMIEKVSGTGGANVTIPYVVDVGGKVSTEQETSKINRIKFSIRRAHGKLEPLGKAKQFFPSNLNRNPSYRPDPNEYK